MTPEEILAHLPDIYQAMLGEVSIQYGQGLAKAKPETLDQLQTLLFLAGAYEITNAPGMDPSGMAIGTNQLSWILLVDCPRWGGSVVHLRDLDKLLKEGP